MVKRILVLAVFPAPYRLNVFKGLAKRYEVDVFFERCKDSERSSSWFEKSDDSFSFVLLTDNKKAYQEKIKKIKDYDLVICYDPWTLTAMGLQLLCEINRIPVAINADGAISVNKAFPQKQIKSYFVKRARLCFAGSNSAVDYFSVYGAKKENIIKHNFTSLFAYEILSAPLDKREKELMKAELHIDNRFTCVAIAQFIERKGFDILLNSWKYVDKSAQLFLIGGGSEEKKYREIIRKNLYDNVTIINYLSHDEIMKFLKASDIFIMPTRCDIWGLVVNEAMSCGIPVISSNCCVSALELIKPNENGYIYELNNINQLSKYINDLCYNEEKRDRFSMGSLEAIKDYTYENIIEKHIVAIDSI